jgi:hypothetical protein
VAHCRQLLAIAVTVAADGTGSLLEMKQGRVRWQTLVCGASLCSERFRMPSIVQPSCGMHALACKPMLVVQQPKPTVVDTSTVTHVPASSTAKGIRLSIHRYHTASTAKLHPANRGSPFSVKVPAPTKALQASDTAVVYSGRLHEEEPVTDRTPVTQVLRE